MEKQEVIEKAALIHGGIRGLARALEVAAPNVSNWKTGKQPVPLHHLARMAEMIGERWEPIVIAEVAKKLGKARAGEVATTLTLLASAVLLGFGDVLQSTTMYIM